MCGIAGWSFVPGADPGAAELAAMAQRIAHRGPDDDGMHVDAKRGIGLAHRRLAIIDLGAGGHQPMATADGAVTLVFNGELYNFAALRRELEALGRVFHSRSDTEVVLNALAQWGRAALGRFDGMYALAAWFPGADTLLLARDPMGIKPLYYAPQGGRGIAFASEIKAFLALSSFRPGINERALRQYLEFGYVFDANDTMLEGVSKLPPGHAMEIVAGRASAPVAHFSLPTARAAGDRTFDAVVDDLHRTLSSVVREHLVADVPVGLLLSGGLDSSVIAALAAREARVTTVAMGFAESAIDERSHARAVARHIGSDHREVLLDPREVVEGLEDVVWCFDDLFADWGTVSTRLLYRKCREEGIKVVLVGEGADELFGGYPVFAAARALRGPMPWRLFQLYRRYAGRRYGGQFLAFASIMQRHLARTGGDLFGAVRLFEACNQLPGNYVMKVDKASMAVGVEARTPYLDRRVATLACGIPAHQLLADGTDKLVLRTMAERHGLLPRAIARRPKFGASIATSWIDDSAAFRRYAGGVVLGRDGWTDRLHLRGAMTDFFSGRRDGYAFPSAIGIFRHLAWRLLLLNLWSRRYLATQ
jgi:asparagine synthase (glutamine-hydrolysing)